MNFLLIDATLNKINFFSKFKNNYYSKSLKKNNEEFTISLFIFLNENNIKLSEISHLFINQGPGNFSGIRTSIAVAKGLSIVNKIDIYGFNSGDLKDGKYTNIVFLLEKGKLKKNLIKPVYMS
tara:strand:- start:376 stop:744 length:369 start_codon:yes stop_codon:yes gene_type:complete